MCLPVMSESISFAKKDAGKMVRTKKSPDCQRHASNLKLVDCVLEAYDAAPQEVSVEFVDSETSSRIHEEHFDDPTPTDCMTFPIDPVEEHGLLGQVIVCPKIAKDYVAENGGNLNEEVSLYVVHGVLHLLGLLDETDEEIQEMRQAEKAMMDLLREKELFLIADDYAS